MNELTSVFKKVLFENYANFNGRASRSEFWIFYFLQYLYTTLIVMFAYIIMIFMLIFGAMKGAHNEPWTVFVILGVIFGVIMLCSLPILLPSIAVTVRRLHDTGRSGWWFLLSFLPLLGFVVYIFLIQAGDKYANQYGPDPLEEEYREYFRKIYPNAEQTGGKG